MGRRSTPKASGHAGKGGKGGASSAVASFKRFGKHLLRHGPDSHGNFLWILRQGPQTEQAILSGKHIAESRTADNCEALRKLQNYISEECATISVGVSYLQEDMGLDFLKYLKRDGADFLTACDFLNRKSESVKEEDQVDRHVKHYFDFLQKLPNERRQQCRRLALHAARLYALSTSFLEQAALVQYPSKWNSSVETKEQHDKSKAFLRNGDDKHLKAWLRAAATTNVKRQREAKKNATADGTSDEAEADGSGSSPEETGPPKGSSSKSSSSSSLDSSSGGKSKKRRGKKATSKKHEKRAKKNEKKNKKSMKAKKEKKRKASSHAQTSPAPKRATEPPKELVDSDDCPEETALELANEQALALAAWQLSEVQSAHGELTDFLALPEHQVTVEGFVKILNLVPEDVRHAFGVKLKTERTRLPKNLAEVLERLKDMFSLAEQFWHAQAAAATKPED